MKTDVSAKVLVDTSVWIAYFRKQEPQFGRLTELIDQDRVACCGVILAELMQGAKSARELKMLKDFLAVFEFPGEATSLWVAAGELSYSLRKSGSAAGLADCYLAALALENGYTVMSLDKHFDEIATTAGLRLL
ncbi:MAG: PIN domain-containing protein [Nitrospirae bacterium]|nr:PIN domain-containing protein [Nitrospirota bacterium]